MGRARLTSRIVPWASERERKLDLSVLQMVTDIDRQSALLAPKLTRALVKSRKINRRGVAYYTVSYGNSQVPYARRRHYENKAHPETLLYLERAGDEVKRNYKKYLPR